MEETVVIGEGVTVGKGSKLKNCVIHPKTLIGENCRVEDAIIGARCTLEELCYVGANTVLADGSVLMKGTRIGGGV